MLPLKLAAQNAPNQIAILSKDFSLTFKELDELVEKTAPIGSVKEPSSLGLILKIFATLRKKGSILISNPKIPGPLIDVKGPPETVLIFTSGSTGKPKIAILSLSNLLKNAEDAIKTLELKPGDEWKLSLPLYHVGGLGILFRCLLAKATVVLDDSPNITHLSYVPTHLYRFSPVYRKLRAILVGGAPTPAYPKNLPVFSSYGLTEMGSIVTINNLVLPKRELSLKEDDEILVKGETLFQGYLGEPLQNGWFATKDLGKLKEGRLEILGRKDWMFISGGENIQPEEIESHLLTHPLVFEAVVIALDDLEFGKKPVAIVRAEKNFSLDTMTTHLMNALPKFKIPKTLYFIKKMPINLNFKVDRLKLLQLAEIEENKNMSGQKKTAYL